MLLGDNRPSMVVAAPRPVLSPLTHMAQCLWEEMTIHDISKTISDHYI